MPDSTTTAPGGGFDFSQLLPLIQSIYQGIHGTPGKDATTAANRADPWGPQRGQYQDQLNAFMKDPSSIFKDPGYVAARDQGLEGVARTMGAAGMGNSGNTLAGLYKYGDTFAYQAEQDKFKQLADLAGVNAGSPAAAGGILMQGDNNRNANTATGLGAIGSLINGLVAAGVPQGIINAIRGALGGGNNGGGPIVTDPNDPNYVGPPDPYGPAGPPDPGYGTGPPLPPDFTPPPIDPGFDIGDGFGGFAGP